MLLSSKQILPFINSDLKGGELAQVGIDLSIENISKIRGGFIGKNRKVIRDYDILIPRQNEEGNDFWVLQSGVYSLTFEQSIKLDEYHTAFVRHKSTILRVGGKITSGVFDPGFECDKIGGTLFLQIDGLVIEKGATLAQLILYENYKAEKYNGSYQGTKDLK